MSPIIKILITLHNQMKIRAYLNHDKRRLSFSYKDYMLFKRQNTDKIYLHLFIQNSGKFERMQINFQHVEHYNVLLYLVSRRTNTLEITFATGKMILAMIWSKFPHQIELRDA